LRRFGRGTIPLWVVVSLAIIGIAALAWWTVRSSSDQTADGRQTLVFWGSSELGEDLYTVLHHFEQKNPQYKVVLSSAIARDLVGDAQRLLCGIAGNVPPDVVFFDRFAIGEWASRGALTDLTELLEKQSPDDPYRIDLRDYYEFAINEASYSRPGSGEKPGVYGIPNTVDVRLLYSNSNMLRQEGLVDAQGEPRPPRTWDELRDYAVRLTRYNTPGNKASGIARLGFAPNFGNSYLYMYAWQAGGEFMNPQRTRITLDSPRVVRALRYMADVYDELGGFALVNGFQQSQQGDAIDPFLTGRVAMKIDTSDVLSKIARYGPDLDFVVTPAPMPADELAKGRTPITWSGGHSYVVPVTSQHKVGAFKLIQYLRSWEATQTLERGIREERQSEGRLYLPKGNANRVFMERLLREHVLGNPQVPARFQEACRIVQEYLPRTFIRPVTPVGQLLWNQHVRAFEAGVSHAMADAARRSGADEMRLALSSMQGTVQKQLDAVLEPPPPGKVLWTPYFVAYGLAIVGAFVLIAIVYRVRKREHGYRAREIAAAMLFVSPWFIGFAVFVGGPIVFSMVLSFTQYDVLSDARYVGIANYRDILSDATFYKSLGNTAFMLLRVPLMMAVSLAIAMLLNRALRGIGLYRTIYYMPAVVPLVATSLLWLWLFNPSYGGFNTILRWLFQTPPMEALQSLLSLRFEMPLWLWNVDTSKPSLILMNLWAAGGTLIIWLAGLQSIPPQLYEAASIDGANAWRRFWNVTFPMLSPYILFNAIIGVIGTMQIFQEAFLTTRGGPVDSTLFYSLNLFYQAFQYFRMGYASAMAWILFILVLALTLLQLWLSKRWVHYDRV
jgi:multiple sugar transport system permease protein